MRRIINGCLVAAAIVGLAGSAGAELRANDDGMGWVPAISAFSGLVSASSAELTEPVAWAEPEQPLAVGDTVEIIQVILVPESVAVAAGAPDAAARYVIEKRAVTGSDGGERWVLSHAEPGGVGTQRADGSASRDALPTDSVGGDDILVEPPVQRTNLAPAPAEPATRDETERWVPSFAVFSGVIAADMEADVSSSSLGMQNQFSPKLGRPPGASDFICDLDFNPVEGIHCNELVVLPAEPVRPAAAGDDLNVEPFIGGQLELMTPGLQKIPGRPRFYVAGDAAWSFGFNRDVAKEQDPGELIITGNFNEVEDSVKGQGSRATIEPQNLVIGANAGMAFTVDIGGRRLRIKPNAGYLRQDLVYTGSVNRALLINTGNAQLGIEPTWETIKLQATDQEVYHALGPGLELELDTGRAGPFLLSLFATGNAYKIISGDRTIEMEATGTWENYLPQDFNTELTETRAVTANWKFVKDPWSYRGAVGLRFRWVPE